MLLHQFGIQLVQLSYHNLSGLILNDTAGLEKNNLGMDRNKEANRRQCEKNSYKQVADAIYQTPSQSWALGKGFIILLGTSSF
jgi:hypothetical protein